MELKTTAPTHSLPQVGALLGNVGVVEPLLELPHLLLFGDRELVSGVVSATSQLFVELVLLQEQGSEIMRGKRS